MRKVSALVCLTFVSVLLALVPAPPGTAASVGNSHPQTGQIVSDDPANFTPHILDGTVYSIVQVGDTVVVGGSFSQVRSATSSTVLTRRNLVAFNATTGVISNTFVPNPNSTVYKVQAALDGESVYVGGRFGSAFGTSIPSRLFKAHVADGTRDPTFRPSTFNGDIRDLEVIDNRLWVAGKFTHIGGTAQKALGTLDATYGTRDSYFTGVFAGTHRDPTVYTGDRTNVLQISSNPANNRLIAVGNFTSVNGTSRSQIVQFDLSGTSTYAMSPWYTTLFTSSCSRNFETIMTDVEYSPNGQFFVVSTTAAWGGMSSAYGGNGCDVVARFESASTSSSSVATWTAYTGGDSTWTVEVTDNVVYAGGHQSWQNNPIGSNRAAQGAVSRPGIAALNAVNGMAWSWNPTRTRGVGVQDMLATSQGLWVGSDTDRIGAYEYHSNIALMPLAGGKTLPVMSNPTLPATIYNVSTTGSTLNRRDFNGTTATPPLPVVTNPATNVPSWGTVVGAFMSNGVLYTATSNGQVTKRTFDGNAYGPPSPVNTADLLVVQTDWHNTDVPSLTSLFFYNGEMFFTRSGQTTMFRRAFEPESDIVGQQRFTVAAVSGINYTTMRGAFVANDKLYYSNTSGQLFRADWAGRGPVAGTSQQVLTAGSGWNSRALFAFGGVATPPVNQPPTADAEVTCTGLTCTFDGTDSADPDGQIQTWAWNFGDPNQTGTGETTTHTYPSAGPRTVTLTVTDDEEASDTDTVQINPAEPVNQPPVASFTVDCDLLECTFNGLDSEDPDGTVETYVWDFGDGETDEVSGANATHTYATSGARTVTLTVTDDDDASDEAEQNINPSDVASPLQFIGAASTVGNRQQHVVAIPGPVEAGDALVLFFAANTTNPTYTGPAGWTEIGDASGSGTTGLAYSKVATAADAAAGATVRVVSSSYAKSQISITAYRGTDATDPVAASASGRDASNGAHTSPTVTAPAGNNWLVTYWADESSATSGWTAPASQTVRNTLSHSGSGHMSGLVTDSNSNVTGNTGGLTAQANSPSSSGVSFSVVLTGGGTAPPPTNQAPTADATVTCTGLTCTFDGTDSADPGGAIDTWEWDFGDPNQTGTGEITTHTYPSAGPRTVTLTVTDDEEASDTDTVQINPAEPVNQPPVASFTVDCDLLECTFNGLDSEDPDGTVETYLWDFGDGETDEVSGANATHTYATSGARTVTLTVTDDDDASDEAEQNINPSDVASPVAFVGAASTVGNRQQHVVAIPGPVEAGDALVLFFAANTTNPTYTGPAGWTEIGSTNGGGTAGRAYSKVATAADAGAGATVRVVSSSYAKSQISIAAYRGTDPASPVAASASGQDSGGTSHISPVVTAPEGSRWLVTYWADESSATSGWTAPASQTVRNTLSHSGSGHMSGVVADSDSDVAGSTGGLTATSNSASSRGVSFSVVLR